MHDEQFSFVRRLSFVGDVYLQNNFSMLPQTEIIPTFFINIYDLNLKINLTEEVLLTYQVRVVLQTTPDGSGKGRHYHNPSGSGPRKSPWKFDLK